VFRLHDDPGTAPRGVEHVTHPIRCVRDRLLLRGSLCLRQRRASLDASAVPAVATVAGLPCRAAHCGPAGTCTVLPGLHTARALRHADFHAVCPAGGPAHIAKVARRLTSPAKAAALLAKFCTARSTRAIRILASACVRTAHGLRGHTTIVVAQPLAIARRRVFVDVRPHDDRCTAPRGVEHVADPIRCRRDCDFLRRSPCLQQRGAIFVHRAVFGVRASLCSASECEGGANGDDQLPSEVHWSFTKSI